MKKTMMNETKWELAEILGVPTYIDRYTLFEEFAGDCTIEEDNTFLYLGINNPYNERDFYTVVYRFTSSKRMKIVPLELYDIVLWLRV